MKQNNVRRAIYGLLLTAAVNALPLVWLFYSGTGSDLNSGSICFCWRPSSA